LAVLGEAIPSPPLDPTDVFLSRSYLFKYSSAVVGQNVKIKTKPLLLSNKRIIKNINKNVVSPLN
jgi:hypothetical protein